VSGSDKHAALNGEPVGVARPSTASVDVVAIGTHGRRGWHGRIGTQPPSELLLLACSTR
jgi:hypothetical protein